jgi:hypothetical protein
MSASDLFEKRSAKTEIRLSCKNGCEQELGSAGIQLAEDDSSLAVVVPYDPQLLKKGRLLYDCPVCHEINDREIPGNVARYLTTTSIRLIQVLEPALLDPTASPNLTVNDLAESGINPITDKVGEEDLYTAITGEQQGKS